MPKQNTVSDEYKILLAKMGENLAQVRREKGMTQRDLSARSEKNQTLIAKLEKYAPMDMSMRSIYEIVRSVPLSFSEFIAKAERDLELEYIPRTPAKVDERLRSLTQKFEDLTSDEQVWMANMIEGLLSQTGRPRKHPDNLRSENQTVASQ